MIKGIHRSDVLFEGGLAIKSSAPVRGDIAPKIADSVMAVIKSAVESDSEIGIKELLTAPLGSTGKKGKEQTSGDIDVGIQLSYDYVEKVKTALKEKFGDMEMNELKGFRILSVGYVYDIDGVKGTAQVDITFVGNLEAAEYFYHSPDYTKDNPSRFKGLFRTEFMKCMVTCIFPDESKYPTEYFEDGKTEKRRWIYRFTPDGIRLFHRSYEGKKGTPIKTHHNIKEDTVSIASTPIEINRFIFGTDDLSVADSFESIWDYVHTEEFRKNSKVESIDMVMDCYHDDLEEKKQQQEHEGVDYNKQVCDYIKEHPGTSLREAFRYGII